MLSVSVDTVFHWKEVIAVSSPTEQILEIIRQLAVERDTFTSDDIRPLLTGGLTTRSIPSAVGKARRDGIIEEIDRVKSIIPERKGSLVGVYRRPGSALATVSSDANLTQQPSTIVSSTAQEIVNLRAYLEHMGYLCGVEELTSVLLMLSSRTWLILSGPSGTGKSSLIRHIASAVGGVLHDVQVKPNWISSEDSLGYYSETSQRFVPGVLSNALIESAKDASERFHFVRLDEMNLAAPEYYLAEVLSAAETWQHGTSGRMESDPIQLPPMPTEVEAPNVALSDNVFLVGTVNVDETTRSLSSKVLDRASVYDLHHVDLFGIPLKNNDPLILPPASPGLVKLLKDRPHSVSELDLPDGLVIEVGELLSQLNTYAQTLGGQIAYRQRDALLTLASLADKHQLTDILSRSAVIDIGIRACILPKWQGSTLAAVTALRGAISTVLELDTPSAEISPEIVRSEIPRSKYPRTADKLASMLEQATTLGYFSAW